MNNNYQPQQLYNQMRCSQCGGFYNRYIGFWSIAIKWSIYVGVLFVIFAAISIVGPVMAIVVKGFALGDLVGIVLSLIVAGVLLSIGVGPYALAYFLEPVMKFQCLHCGYLWRQKGRPQPMAKWFIAVTFILFITLGAGIGPMILLVYAGGAGHR